MDAEARKVSDTAQAPRLAPLVAFTLAYLVAAAFLAVVRGNLEFLFYIAVMLVLIGTVWVVHRYVGLNGTVL